MNRFLWKKRLAGLRISAGVRINSGSMLVLRHNQARAGIFSFIGTTKRKEGRYEKKNLLFDMRCYAYDGVKRESGT